MMDTREQKLLDNACASALNIKVWQLLQDTDKLNKGRWRKEAVL